MAPILCIQHRQQHSSLVNERKRGFTLRAVALNYSAVPISNEGTLYVFLIGAVVSTYKAKKKRKKEKSFVCFSSNSPRSGNVEEVWRCYPALVWHTSNAQRNPTTMILITMQSAMPYGLQRSGWMTSSPMFTWRGTSPWQ